MNVAFGLIFFSIFNTWLVRATTDFLALLNILCMILNMAFWRWRLGVIFYNWGYRMGNNWVVMRWMVMVSMGYMMSMPFSPSFLTSNK